MLNTKTQTLLERFSQKRLCAVFIDKDTFQPIKNLPVYAELLLTVMPVPKRVELKSKYLWGQLSNLHIDLNQQQLDKIMSALEEYLTANYGEVSEEDYMVIMDAYVDKISPYLKTEDYLDNKDLARLIEEFMDELIADQRIAEPHPEQQKQENTISCPFGYLATDHVGYLSYDVEEQIKQYRKLLSQNDNGHSEMPDPIINVQYWLYPNGDMNSGIDVSFMGRVTAAYVFGNSISIPASKSRISAMAYQSMQKPDLIDWYLSPSSFSVNPRYLIGEDGCERMFPANFATSEFRFFQIVRGNEIMTNQNNLPIRHGFAYEYITLWQPLGHTLGQIIYSLPLAPGEVVKIGIVDWKRSSEDTRVEDTSESEDLAHNTVRDRTISETVQGALREWQRGGSIMGGNSGGAGVSFGIPIIGATAGNAHSFGGGYSTSSGDRNFTVDTVQQVNDAFSQHSSAIRELRSTIVVTSEQQEYARAETRVIANNNHSHALTMLYYEVLRHFKVTTQFVRRRNVLLVDYSRWEVDFNNEYVVNRYRSILEASLLEPRYITYFDVVHVYLAMITETNYQNSKIVQPADEGELIFSRFHLQFVTGSNTFNGTAVVKIHTNDGVNHTLMDQGINRGWFDGSFEEGEPDDFDAWTHVGLRWRDMDAIIIMPANDNGSPGDTNAWLLRTFVLTGILETGEQRTLFNGNISTMMEVGNPDHASQVLKQTNRPPVRVVLEQSPMDVIQPQERMHIDLLKRHLIDNADYYKRIIWLSQDVNDRARWMEDVELNGNSKLIDKIENRPIDIMGNYVVFPSNYKIQETENDTHEIYAKTEKLMTLPTRGVFGEAKLGNCNASEVIDNTRFWDWQQSPIMEKAPDIDAISTASRNVTQNLTPTPFPQPIVNIVNPTPAPDPTGMAGALNLLGKSDIFRDMSMSKEVTDLLKKLSDNSVSFAEAANQARGILNKQNSDGGNTNNGGDGTDGSQNNSNSGVGTDADPKPSNPTAEQKETRQLDNTEKKLDIAKQHLTPKQQQEVREKVKQDLVEDLKPIYIALHTSDGGGVVNIRVPADYDINQEYQGKLPFTGGTTTAKTKLNSGTFHIKAEGLVPSFEGREYIRKLPGYSNPNGVYYFETSCNFDFKGTKSIALNGMVTLSEPVEVVLYADVNGKISAEFNAGVEFPVEIAKVSLGSKVAAQVGGAAGFKLTYKVYSITGMSLKQQ